MRLTITYIVCLVQLAPGFTSSLPESSPSHLYVRGLVFYHSIVFQGYDTMRIAPSAVLQRNLTALSAQIETPHGRAEVVWSAVSEHSGNCGKADENDDLHLFCPEKIESIAFASFGTPSGL